MKAFVIMDPANVYSVRSADACIASADTYTPLDVKRKIATIPDGLTKEEIDSYTYPLQGAELEMAGMLLRGYKCFDHRLKIACTLSHAGLWDLCAREMEPILILEHDARFVRSFDPEALDITDGQIVAINDPRGATRRGRQYHKQIMTRPKGVWPALGINQPEERQPDGLPGNSAYIITPQAAVRAIGLLEVWGIWPNDALLCRQFFPGQLFTLNPYATKVEQEKSTTT